MKENENNNTQEENQQLVNAFLEATEKVNKISEKKFKKRLKEIKIAMKDLIRETLQFRIDQEKLMSEIMIKILELATDELIDKSLILELQNIQVKENYEEEFENCLKKIDEIIISRKSE